MSSVHPSNPLMAAAGGRDAFICGHTKEWMDGWMSGWVEVWLGLSDE